MSPPPVYAADFPDPFVLRTEAGYLAFSTNVAGVNVPVMASEDLASWRTLGDALPRLAGWAQAGHTWAPAVLARPGGFVLYVTVREPVSGRQAITVASSSRPEGPYEDTSTGPFVFQWADGGSIDPSPFVDATGDGRAYLLWKCDANARGRPSTLWAQRLTDDGLGLVGQPAQLLVQDRRWEHPAIEAPSLVCESGRYHLFYSANWWESDGYGVGYAVGDSVLGPYRKVTTRKAWFGSDSVVAGPGGQELFAAPDGGWRMAYHGWTPGQVGYPAGGARSLHIVTVDFAGRRPAVL